MLVAAGIFQNRTIAGLYLVKELDAQTTALPFVLLSSLGKVLDRACPDMQAKLHFFNASRAMRIASSSGT